jgi:hypothetical protein
MIGLPPFQGAVQLTVALALPAEAVTPLGAEGAVGAAPTRMNEATEGTPAELTMKTM